VDDGAWHTVQCVKTASAIKLVVDGRSFSQAARVGSIANSAAVVIGARPESEFFRGSLDEASIDIGGAAPPQPAPAPSPQPAPQPVPDRAPSPAPAPSPAAEPTPITAPAAPAVAPPVAASAAAATLLRVSSTTFGRARLVLRGRLGADASADRLRVTLTRRTRHHGTIRVTSRPIGGRSGTWRSVPVLPRAARGLRSFTVSVRYLGETGHRPATLGFTAVHR